jgi:hypothetical protein
MFNDPDFSSQKNRDKMIWTTVDLRCVFFLGGLVGLIVGFLLGLVQ